MKRHWLLWVIMVMLCACTTQEEKEKYQGSRNNVIDVKEKIKEIDTGNDVLIGNNSRSYYSKDFLIIQDSKAWEGAIHLFDKTTFKYITSFGKKGEGPFELTNMGDIFIDDNRRKLYVTDHGKNKIFSYDMDSVINMPDTYRHQVKIPINNTQFPAGAIYINDTLSYCRIIVPTSNSTFDQMIGKWNMMTGELKMIGEKHPKTHRKRSLIDVSIDKKMIVEVYYNYDLMSISDLDGNIQCYIYGPDWTTKGLDTFGDVMITPNHILASYSGNKWAKGKTDKIHVFDLKGNYIKTLNIGYAIQDCSYDSANHRIFMIFNDEIQFGYIDLTELV